MKVTYKKKEKEQEKEICLICCNEIEYYSIYECEHNLVCWKCCLTQRELLKDKSCCVCKQQSERVIITKEEPKGYLEYDLKKFKLDEKYKVYYDRKEIIDQLQGLRLNICYLCSKKKIYDKIEELKEHVKKEHELYYCDLCLNFRKVFMIDQKLYTFNQLKNHQKQGEVDPEYGLIKFHPLCKFCNKRFYSDDEIFEHMHLSHYECHICKQQGNIFEYYKDYNHLQSHFNIDHYACQHPFCLEQRFIVFSNSLDLSAHESKVHKKKGFILFENKDKKMKRRMIRTGEIDSNCIRFVGQDSEYNDQFKPNQNIKNNNKKEEISDLLSEQDKKKRNELLIIKMKSLLNDSQFQDFKSKSIQYQKGQLMAMEYIKILLDTFGYDHLPNIVPEMIDLMPEKNKNQSDALRKAYDHIIMDKDLTDQIKNMKLNLIEKDDFPSLSKKEEKKEEFPSLPIKKNPSPFQTKKKKK